jgi:hypothetical protein
MKVKFAIRKIKSKYYYDFSQERFMKSLTNFCLVNKKEEAELIIDAERLYDCEITEIQFKVTKRYKCNPFITKNQEKALLRKLSK